MVGRSGYLLRGDAGETRRYFSRKGMVELIPETVEKDIEARAALWRAICVASEDVMHRFRVKSICGVSGSPIRNGAEAPDVPTWRLVEALSLLGPRIYRF